MRYFLALCAVAIGLLVACFGNEVALKGGAYAYSLEECNRQAKTLCQSIDCENHDRLRAGRFPRTLPPHCLIKDAGADVLGRRK